MRVGQQHDYSDRSVTDDKRARVMSYYTMAFFGGSPFGSLLAGALAHRIGAPDTVMITGAFCVAGSLWFMVERPKVQSSSCGRSIGTWVCCRIRRRDEKNAADAAGSAVRHVSRLRRLFLHRA